MWEGAGEYQCIEFATKERYFIKSDTFDRLRTHCPICAKPMLPLYKLQPTGKDFYKCDEHGKFVSISDEPMISFDQVKTK